MTAEKTLLITGAGSGIGLACAETLQRRGWRVLATARKAQDIARLNAMGFTGLYLELQDASSVKALADEVLQITQNRLYALFNNAGYGHYGRLASVSRAQLERQFAANFFGVHQLTMLLLPAMLAQGEGRIIINSSVVGKVSTPGRGAYAASKHALEGWADSLRMELHGSGVQVSLIEPGPINSAFTRNVQQDPDLPPVENPPLISRFMLEPSAVVEKVCHALDSRRARARYPVTLVAHLALWLNRLLPARVMDGVLRGKG